MLLEVNVDSASSIYPRQCARCDYVANSKATHWYHMRSQHTGERFPCDQCEYSATQLSALKVHMQSKHEGMKERNYKYFIVFFLNKIHFHLK